MEECRYFDVTLMSTSGLILKNEETIYAVAYISGISGYDQKFKTPDTHTPDSAWNFRIELAIREHAIQQTRLTLVVKIMAKRSFFDKILGEVGVPIKGLLKGAIVQGTPLQSVSYQLSGKYGGVVNFTYEFSEIYLHTPPTAGYYGNTRV